MILGKSECKVCRCVFDTCDVVLCVQLMKVVCESCSGVILNYDPGLTFERVDDFPKPKKKR